MEFIKKNFWLAYGIIAVTILYVWISFYYSPAPAQTHYVDLAYSFLHGHLDFITPLRIFDDYSIFQGKIYNYFGPAPAVFLLPFVFIFSLSFPQIILSLLCSIVNLFVLYKICRKIGIKKESDALWLSGFFLFGTVYGFLAVTNITAFLVQVFGVTFLNLALYLYFSKKSFWLIGLCVAIAGLTRFTLLLGSVFFLLEILNGFNIKKYLAFLVPIILGVAILFLYNAVRFQNPFETGYGLTVTNNQIYQQEKSHGVFNIINIPGNLYFLFFRGPDPVRADDITYILKFPYLRVNEWGLGIFFTSPLFLYLFFVKLKEKYIINSIITSFVILIPIITYYNPGLWQYGYRYALDFYPFLFIVLIDQFKEGLPMRAKGFIVYSIVFNLFFMYSIWNIYPFLSKIN